MKQKALVFFVAAVLPLLVWQGFSISKDFSDQKEEADFNLLKEAITAAGDQKAYITQTRQLLEGLAALPVVQNRDSRSCGEYLKLLIENLKNRIYTGIILTDSKGDAWCGSLPIPGAGVNIADRPYFKRAIENKAFTIGEYQIGRLSGIAGIPFAHPIFGKSGEVIGMIIVQINIHELVNYFSADKLKASFVFLLLDRNGTLIARLPTSPKLIGQMLDNRHPFFEILKRREQGDGLSDNVFEAMDFDGTQRTFGLTQVSPESDFYLLAGIESSRHYRSVYDSLFKRISILFVLIFLGGFLLAAAQRILKKQTNT